METKTKMEAETETSVNCEKVFKDDTLMGTVNDGNDKPFANGLIQHGDAFHHVKSEATQ
jgi:hypothetical protein